MNWQLQEAKQRFSELVRTALASGPQYVTRHGDIVAVLLSFDEYRRLTGQEMSFKEFLRSGPDLSELDLTRSKELSREIEFE